MEKERMQKNLFEYLDFVFKDKSPNDDQIEEAKKHYRKYYQNHYQEVYKQKHIQISFRINKKEYEFIKAEALLNQKKINRFLKLKALKKEEKNENHIVKNKLSNIIDDFEDFVFRKRVPDFELILKKLIEIESEL